MSGRSCADTTMPREEETVGSGVLTSIFHQRAQRLMEMAGMDPWVFWDVVCVCVCVCACVCVCVCVFCGVSCVLCVV